MNLNKREFLKLVSANIAGLQLLPVINRRPVADIIAEEAGVPVIDAPTHIVTAEDLRGAQWGEMKLDLHAANGRRFVFDAFVTGWTLNIEREPSWSIPSLDAGMYSGSGTIDYITKGPVNVAS
jgi:hypothetical protein